MSIFLVLERSFTKLDNARKYLSVDFPLGFYWLILYQARVQCAAVHRLRLRTVESCRSHPSVTSQIVSYTTDRSQLDFYWWDEARPSRVMAPEPMASRRSRGWWPCRWAMAPAGAISWPVPASLLQQTAAAGRACGGGSGGGGVAGRRGDGGSKSGAVEAISAAKVRRRVLCPEVCHLSVQVLHY